MPPIIYIVFLLDSRQRDSKSAQRDVFHLFHHSKTNFISSHRRLISSISRVEITHMSKFKPGTVEKIHHQLHIRPPSKIKPTLLKCCYHAQRGGGVSTRTRIEFKTWSKIDVYIMPKIMIV